MRRIWYDRDYLRSCLFGLEDSLVSTTGMVVGIAAGSQNKETVLLAGLVAISVEAVAMGAGQFTSSETEHELEHNKFPTNKLTTTAVIMFVSYIAGGLVPILPFLIFDFNQAVFMSVALTLTSLFTLGFVKAKIIGQKPTRSAIEMLLIGGVATVIGVVVGFFLNGLTN